MEKKRARTQLFVESIMEAADILVRSTTMALLPQVVDAVNIPRLVLEGW